MRACGVLLLLGLIASPAWAQATVDRRIDGPPAPQAPEVVSRSADGSATISTRRLPGPLKVDGRLDEAFYETVQSVSDFVQQEPFEGEPATEKTEVWVFFDDEAVYVAARNWESDPSKRVMSDMQRDSRNLGNNDHFGVLFDTFYDRRNGYYFYVNAQGGRYDVQVTNESPNSNWNGLWDVRTADFDGGWTIEFRFPFRSLRFQEEGRVWGIQFRRMVRWKNEASYLTPVVQSLGRAGLTRPALAGTLVGLESPGRLPNVDLKPYLLGSSLTDRNATPAFDNLGNGEFGLDAKWGITQSTVADFTYNTDFAQVEDDVAQVNLTRFSLFFPEKREFFLEGSDYFNFGSSGFGGSGGGGGGGGGRFGSSSAPVVFYSRRIGLESGEVVPIRAGGRLLSRGNGFQVGALQMRTGELADEGIPSADFSVLRVSRDLFSRSRVGMIATRRVDANGPENYAYGLDTTLNVSTELSASGYWAQTDTPDLAGSDTSYQGQVRWNTDGAGFTAQHLYVGGDFNPEIGFVRRSAFRRSFGQARYSPRPRNLGNVRKLFYEAQVDYYENTAGQLESREIEGAFRIEFTSTDKLNVEFKDIYERIDGAFDVADGVTIPPGGYTFRQASVRFELPPSRPVSGFVGLRYGGFYGGTLTELSWSGRVEFSSQLYAEPSLSFNRVDTPFGRGNANLIGSRLTYTLTPQMFVGALIQYRTASASVSTNARFRWEFQPGSDLFIVYSDGRSAIDGGFPTQLDNRSVVIKITRLFRW